MAKSTAVVNPNLGIYTDRTPLALSPKMLQDGMNFRINEGKLSNLNLGWTRFAEDVTLNGPVTLITDFLLAGSTDKLIFGTDTDLYEYVAGSESVSFITPRYDTGTVAVSGTAVTGSGTSWAANAAEGDEIHFGDAAYRNPSGVWYTISNVGGNTAITLSATAGTIGAGTAYTIRRKFTGDAGNIWVHDTFVNAAGSNENHWFATNGVDYPVRWNGTDTQVTSMSALAFKCKTLAVYSNMMIYGNITQGGNLLPSDIINSHTGEPSNVSSGLSEQFKVHGDEGGITAMVPIGDGLAIYSKQNVTLAQFFGGDIVFAFRQVIAGIGSISYRGVADFGDYHHFLSFDTMYEFDGATIKETGSHIWRDLIRSHDPSRRDRIYHHFDDEHAELIWSLPLAADAEAGEEGSPPEKATVLHYLEDTGQNIPKPYSRRSFPFTAIGYWVRQDGLTWDVISDTWADLNFRWDDQFFQASFPLIIVGDDTGKLFTLNTSQNGNDTALPSYVHFSRRPLFDGMTRGLITRVMPFMRPFDNDVNITVHMADHAEGVATISDTQAFDQNLVEGEYFTAHYRRGRYMELEVGSDGPSEPWEISGYDIATRPGGRR